MHVVDSIPFEDNIVDNYWWPVRCNFVVDIDAYLKEDPLMKVGAENHYLDRYSEANGFHIKGFEQYRFKMYVCAL